VRRRPRLGFTRPQHSSARVVRRPGGKTAETVWQNRRQAASKQGTAAARARGEERREEADEWARPEFKILNKNQILLQFDPFQKLASKLGKNP
jgi:hypothetical protein